MKIRPIWWFIIIFSACVIPLILVFFITRIWMNPPVTWWAFFIILIIEVVLAIISGIIFLVVKLKTKKEPKIRLEPKDAREKAVYELKMDEDNPDNFIVQEQRIMKVGMQGYPRTPVLWLHGKGSEKNSTIDAIINLDNPKVEISWMINKTEKEVKDAIRLTADNPETEIMEEKTMGLDEFGRPTTRIMTKRLSTAEKQLEDEKKKVEEANAL